MESVGKIAIVSNCDSTHKNRMYSNAKGHFLLLDGEIAAYKARGVDKWKVVDGRDSLYLPVDVVSRIMDVLRWEPTGEYTIPRDGIHWYVRIRECSREEIAMALFEAS